MSTATALQPEIDDERLYRIGEVSRLSDLKPFVLRYWETEFPMLEPVKSPSGHRMYRQQDVDMVFKIKRLLYDEGFTIAGARRHLRETNGAIAVEPSAARRLPLEPRDSGANSRSLREQPPNTRHNDDDAVTPPRSVRPRVSHFARVARAPRTHAPHAADRERRRAAQPQNAPRPARLAPRLLDPSRTPGTVITLISASPRRV